MKTFPPNTSVGGIEIRDGWALNAICHLDSVEPIAGYYLRSSPARRQVIHAVLASEGPLLASNEIDDNGAKEKLVSLTRSLISDQARDLLVKVYRTCPPGIRGALAKLGPHAERPDFYGDLISTFADPEQASIIKALRHMPRITAQTLAIARMLPVEWRSSGLVARLGTPGEARNFLQAVTLIRRHCPAATDGELHRSIKQLSRSGTIEHFVAGWLSRAVFPGPPIASDELVPLRTGKELRSIARSMRNCLREQIPDIIAGTSTFYLIKGVGMEVVAHLHRASAGAEWVLEDIYGPHNLPLPTAVADQAYGVLARHGIDPDHRVDHVASAAEAVRSYLWSAQYRRRRRAA